jgi:hypothetical protein
VAAKRPVGDVVGEDDEDGVGPSQIVEPKYVCVLCHPPREFKGKSGLGVHRRHAHIEVVNADITTARKNKRWNEEEKTLLAEEEAISIVEGGVQFMNQRLHSRFPGRTLDALKGMRKKPEYRAEVESLDLKLRLEKEGRSSILGDTNVPEIEEMPEKVVIRVNI